MKIAHSLYNWLPGTMTWVYTQLQYLPGAESIVLADQVQNGDLFPWEPVYVPTLLKKPALDALLFQVVRRLGLRWHPKVHHEALVRHAPDILHSHFGDRGWYDLPLAQRHNLRQVVTFYGYDISMLPLSRPYWRERYRQLFAHADHFLCEGPHMAHSLAELGCPADKITVQPLGVKVGSIPFRERRLGDNEPLKILIAGSFREKKGIPDALEAIGMVRREHPALRATVIGDAGGRAAEQREKQKIIEVIHKYGLKEVVTLTGYQPHERLIREYYQHHLFLSPSVTATDGDTEGGAPVTVIEAALSGMPVIGTTHCDIPFVVQDGKSGLLVPERDVPALAAAIRKLIGNRELIPRLGREGSAAMQKDHDAERQAARLRDIYGQVASRGRVGVA